MRVGVPGRIEELGERDGHLAAVHVAGVVRRINVGLVEDDPAVLGDWLLIPAGIAMAKIDQAEAKPAMDGLRMTGQGVDDELQQLLESQIG